jgi:hypothetical protein
MYFIIGNAIPEIHLFSRPSFSIRRGRLDTRVVICCITKTAPLCTDPSWEDLQPIEFMHPTLNASPYWTQQNPFSPGLASLK